MDPLDPQSDYGSPVAPGTAALLECWLAASGALDRKPAPEPDTACLVAYLCGRLEPQDAAAVEASLVASRERRGRLSAARTHLDHLQRLDWERLEQRARGIGPEAAVARAWRSLAGEVLAAGACRDWRLLAAPIRAGAAAGAALAALRGLGERLRAVLAAPQLALARGGDSEVWLVVAGAEDTRALLSVELDTAGGLLARAELRGPLSAASVEGFSLVLHFAAGGESWRLGAAPVTGGTVRWELPGLGAALNLPAGPLPPVWFRLTLALPGASTPELTVPGGRCLPARFESAAGAAAEWVSLPILDGPAWHDEELSLLIELPEEVRRRCAGGRLELLLPVAPRAAQLLGTWPVGVRPTLSLRVPCPGVAPAPVDEAAFLEARLLPGAHWASPRPGSESDDEPHAD